MSPLAPHFLALSVALTPKKAVETLTYDLKRPEPSSLLLHITLVPWLRSREKLGQEL